MLLAKNLRQINHQSKYCPNGLSMYISIFEYNKNAFLFKMSTDVINLMCFFSIKKTSEISLNTKKQGGSEVTENKTLL